MLARTVTEAARRFGDRSAVVAASGRALGYRELDQLSDECAAGLRRRGVGEGHVVALVLPPCPEHFVLVAAVAKVGAAAAAVNHRLTAAERAAVLGAALPDLTLAAPDLDPGPGTPGQVQVVVPAAAGEEPLRGLRAEGAAPAAVEEDPDRPVAIVFTSGTTGLPRGAVFGGRQLEFICEVDTAGAWGDPAAPAVHALAGTSLAHLGPTTKLPGTLRRGVTTHLVDRWKAADALDLTARHRMPAVAGIPTQVALMARDPSIGSVDLSCVRSVVMGGGPATPDLVRGARDAFAAPVSVRYACTEAGVGVGTAPTDPDEDAEVSVGRPHPGVELTVRDPDGRPLPDGQVGEVCLRSPAVMSGYHRDPVSTAAAFWGDGAVRTGDLGRLDDRGRLRLAGRLGERYVRGGENVHPFEVESVLADHPGVAEVAVVGRPDPVMGEVGVAFVVANAGSPAPDREELARFAGDRLAPFKLPAEVVAVDALPLTAMDKVDRRRLHDLVRTERG